MTKQEHIKALDDRLKRFKEIITTGSEKSDMTDMLLIELLQLMSLDDGSEVKTHCLFLHDTVTLEEHPEPLKKAEFPLKQGVTVKADNDNAGTVYVGNNDNITPSNGFRLQAAESVIIEIDDLAKVFAFGSQANQKIYWLGV